MSDPWPQASGHNVNTLSNPYHRLANTSGIPLHDHEQSMVRRHLSTPPPPPYIQLLNASNPLSIYPRVLEKRSARQEQEKYERQQLKKRNKLMTLGGIGTLPRRAAVRQRDSDARRPLHLQVLRRRPRPEPSEGNREVICQGAQAEAGVFTERKSLSLFFPLSCPFFPLPL